MKRGMFLSFEGGEASGKSVQAEALARSLEQRDVDVVPVHEPGSTPLGERVRDILLHASDVPLTPEAQALLFSASRAQLVHDVIRPALEAGRTVIADRFYDSTLVYQGHGQNADRAGILAVTAFAVDGVRPDRTFLLDVPIDVALARRARQGGRSWDRFEASERAFHERLREGYLALARAEPERFVVINADREESAVASDIRRSVEQLLGVPSPP